MRPGTGGDRDRGDQEAGGGEQEDWCVAVRGLNEDAGDRRSERAADGKQGLLGAHDQGEIGLADQLVGVDALQRVNRSDRGAGQAAVEEGDGDVAAEPQ